MYRFTGKNANGDPVEPLPGLPLEAADKDFNACRDAYDAFNGQGAFEAVKKSGLYQHTPDAKAPASQED